MNKVGREEWSKLWTMFSFSAFSRLGTFSQVFGQVKELLTLELHKIIKVLHKVVCSIVFILFFEQSWQGEVFKVMKTDHILVLLAVWVLFLKILGRLRDELCLNRAKYNVYM